jgi:hypothetical protein
VNNNHPRDGANQRDRGADFVVLTYFVFIGNSVVPASRNS